MTGSNGRTHTSTTVGLSDGDGHCEWVSDGSCEMLLRASYLTSLAGNTRDERGNAEEGEGAHVDNAVERDGVVMRCGCVGENGWMDVWK